MIQLRPQVVVGSLLALFLGWAVAFIHATSFVAIDDQRYFTLFDDAMISMRYAWNLTHGLGLCWNADSCVEGYTNLLHVLGMTLPNLLLPKPLAPLMVQAFTLLFLLGTAASAAQLGLDQQEEDGPILGSWMGGLLFLGVLSYYPLVYWSLLGMETSLLAWLLVLGVRFTLQEQHGSERSRALGWAVMAGLGFLTRNDSLPAFAWMGLYILFTARSQAGRRWSVIGWMVFGAFVLGQFGFRLAYYGDWLPNTYRLKLEGLPLDVRLHDGIRFVLPFLLQSSLLLLIPLVGLLRGFDRRQALLSALVWTGIAYQVYTGGDAWDSWRMLCPFMPLAIVACLGAALRLASLQKHFQPRTLAALGLLAALLAADARFLDQILGIQPALIEDHHAHIDIAIALRESTTDNATLGVFWAGVIPYFSGRKSFDFLGKSEREIAALPPDLSGTMARFGMKTLPGHNKYDLNHCVQTWKPTYLQYRSFGRQQLDPAEESQYVLASYQGIRLLLRKDSPDIRSEKLRRIEPSSPKAPEQAP